MPFIKCRLLWHELSLPIIFLSLFPLKSVIANLDWLSSTESLLPWILPSSLSLAESYHHGKRTSFIVETIQMFPTLLFGCHELTIATLHSILLSPNGFATDVTIWKNTKLLPLYSRILNQTLTVALARLLAREGQTMDSMFDPPSQCSPHEHMSSFNTMTKMTYMITQQL